MYIPWASLFLFAKVGFEAAADPSPQFNQNQFPLQPPAELQKAAHVLPPSTLPLADASRGTADPDAPYWRETIKHQGTSAFNPNPEEYKVFRNVKDYGAVGDGVADDSLAINLAIADGDRCGNGECESSTITPAVVYFPAGTYRVKNAIQPFYYTQLLGDARNPPTILADESFRDFAVIDADPYIPGGAGRQWFTNQNNFFRSVKNFVIDTRLIPPQVAEGDIRCIHWQVAQATSLQNIKFYMSDAPNTDHQGIWMENGSGGYMGDLEFNGGKYGIWGGNQQFTVRNVVFNNVQIAVFAVWNWGWTFQRVEINNCGTGFNILTGGLTSETQSVGSEAIIDGYVSNTVTFIHTSKTSQGSLAGSIVLNNIDLQNVKLGITAGDENELVLEGGTRHIEAWGQGNVYNGSDSTPHFTQGDIPAPKKADMLLDKEGKIVSKGKPQYEDYSIDQVVSVKDYGAKGDGKTDDREALQKVLDQFADKMIIFVDAGTYLVTDTLIIPPGTRMTGEAWSVIAGTGSAFKDQNNPKPVIQVGTPGSQGIVEISDMIFSTQGTAPGAIVVEWNIQEPYDTQAGAGMWDTHIRLGGSASSGLEFAQCPKGNQDYEDCTAAYLSLHLTSGSTGYFESNWVWPADHDLDGDGVSQVSLFAGRGVLSESQGPVWLIGTASEHHTIYQYNLVKAKNHYIGFAQTETPYYQPTPAVPAPFLKSDAYHDPEFPEGLQSALAFVVTSSEGILLFGGGFWSFYSEYEQTCSTNASCQSHIVSIDSQSKVQAYSVSTIGTAAMLSLDGKAVIKQSDNVNGFQSTLTFWESS